MNPSPPGTRVRVIANEHEHNYRIGGVYEITAAEDDGTFKAKNRYGIVGDWLRWEEVESAGEPDWQWLMDSITNEDALLLDPFDGVDALTLKPEIRNKILIRLPDLRKLILEASNEIVRPIISCRDRGIPCFM